MSTSTKTTPPAPKVCAATLKTGDACPHAAKDDSLFCGTHARCTAPTSSGKKCTRKAVTSNRLCNLHLKVALTPPKTKIGNREMTALGHPNPTQCISITKKGTRCTRNSVGDTHHCSIPAHKA